MDYSQSSRITPSTKSFSASSPSSSSSSTNMTCPPPLPPMSPSSFTIPFSWEKHPGVPKQGAPCDLDTPPPTLMTLPLPPPIKPKPNPPPSSSTSTQRKKKPDLQGELDPFSAALMECSKQEQRWKATGTAVPASPSRKGARRGYMFAFRWPFDLYGSCRSSNASVVDSTVYVLRSGQSTVAYGLPHRRDG